MTADNWENLQIVLEAIAGIMAVLDLFERRSSKFIYKTFFIITIVAAGFCQFKFRNELIQENNIDKRNDSISQRRRDSLYFNKFCTMTKLFVSDISHEQLSKMDSINKHPHPQELNNPLLILSSIPYNIQIFKNPDATNSLCCKMYFENVGKSIAHHPQETFIVFAFNFNKGDTGNGVYYTYKDPNYNTTLDIPNNGTGRIIEHCFPASNLSDTFLIYEKITYLNDYGTQQTPYRQLFFPCIKSQLNRKLYPIDGIKEPIMEQYLKQIKVW